MKKIMKAILSAGLSLSCVLAGFSFFTTTVKAEETFPGKGYNVIASESKVFRSNDEAYAYCQSHAWDLYKKLGKEIQYQVIYLGQSQFQATFYAYNYQDGDLTPTPTPAPSTNAPVMSVKITAYELNVRKDAGTSAQLADWGPLSAGMVVDVYDSKRDSDQTVWNYVKVNGQEGFICSTYTERESKYTGTVDTTPDANETAFAKGKTKLDKETRVFVDNASAVAYASNYGVTISNRNGGKLLYYYVSYAGPENFVIHFYY